MSFVICTHVALSSLLLPLLHGTQARRLASHVLDPVRDLHERVVRGGLEALEEVLLITTVWEIDAMLLEQFLDAAGIAEVARLGSLRVASLLQAEVGDTVVSHCFAGARARSVAKVGRRGWNVFGRRGRVGCSTRRTH
jgi:hypothetical protein